MSSTTVRGILSRVQRVLARNTGDDFQWTESELLEHFNGGVQELWREIKGLGQDHFLTVDATNVSLAASTATLSGVPTDVDTIHAITSRTPQTAPGILFTPTHYRSVEFQRALAQGTVDPSNYSFYYAMSAQGGPVGAVVVYVAPLSTSAVTLKLVYTPTLADSAITGTNPIPGQSDSALIAWTLAWALAKTAEDRAPLPSYLAMFETAKDKLLVSLTQRQIDEPRYVEAVFEDYWNG